MNFQILSSGGQLKYKGLGPGLLESTYEQCLAYELSQAKIPFKLQLELPVEYKQIRLIAAIELICWWTTELLLN